MPTVVITGANNGIGWAMAKQLIEKGWKVYATSRTVGPKMQELNTEHKHQLDVTSVESIQNFTHKVFGDQPLDILINNAAIMNRPNDTLTAVSMTDLERVFACNAFGPLILTQALLPNLFRSKQPRIGNVTSRIGSVGDNSSGGSYSYRASKAALNMISKNLAVELKDKGVIVSVLHPGMVESGMVKKKRPDDGVIMADEAAEKLLGILMNSKIEESGMFWHRDGFELPW